MRLRCWMVPVKGQFRNILIVDHMEDKENPEFLLDEFLSSIFDAVIYSQNIDLEGTLVCNERLTNGSW